MYLFSDIGKTTVLILHLALKKWQKLRTLSQVIYITKASRRPSVGIFQIHLDICLFAEGGGSGEESDVLSINADIYDSDIEGPKDETVKALTGTGKVDDSVRDVAEPAVKPHSADPEPPAGAHPVQAKRDIQQDIDKSVSEILSFSSASSGEVAIEQSEPLVSSDAPLPVQGGPVSSRTPSVCQPSIQQLELLELEMRARAIKALMKASTLKRPSVADDS